MTKEQNDKEQDKTKKNNRGQNNHRIKDPNNKRTT